MKTISVVILILASYGLANLLREDGDFESASRRSLLAKTDDSTYDPFSPEYQEKVDAKIAELEAKDKASGFQLKSYPLFDQEKVDAQIAELEDKDKASGFQFKSYPLFDQEKVDAKIAELEDKNKASGFQLKSYPILYKAKLDVKPAESEAEENGDDFADLETDKIAAMS